MSISLTINADTPHDLKGQLADLLRGHAGHRDEAAAKESAVTDAVVNPVPKAETAVAPKRTRKPAQSGGEMPDEKPEEIAAIEPAPTIKDVTDALLKFVNDYEDEETPPKILAEFGVKKISEAKPADYAKIIARAEEELEKKAKAK